VPITKSKKGDLVISVKQIGNVEAERNIAITSSIEGRITFLAPEGKAVRPGEVIIKLDELPLQDAVNSATANYTNTLSQLQRARLELEILKESNKNDVAEKEAQLSFDKAELERAEAELAKKKQLVEERLITRSEVDIKEIDVRSKKFALQKSEKQLELKKKEVANRESQKQTEVSNIEFQVSEARRKLAEAKMRLSKATITAPGAGLVVIGKTWSTEGPRKLKEGDNIWGNLQLMQLPDLSSMQIKVQVDEADIAKVKVGQKAKITLDALPGKYYQGEVKSISNLASEGSRWDPSTTPGRKNFEVIVRVLKTGQTPLRPGMTANTEIISEVIPKTVYVPVDAVFEQKGKRYVFVQKGDKYERRMVKTGKRNENSVAVLSGLKEGEILALRDPNEKQPDLEKTNAKGAAIFSVTSTPAASDGVKAGQ